jgi:D-glycero-alpha-D-manno-heptose-7-phosphate kinase
MRLMKDLLVEAISVLSGNQDIIAFGELLHEAWQAKRSLSSVISNDQVDVIYEQALSVGAIGGKLMGAGGGGFILLFVPPSKHEKVKEKLNKLIHVPFRFEFGGSQIIFFDPEEDYSAAEKARAGRPVPVFRELANRRA